MVARIDVQGVQDTISTLRKFEPELYKQLIKDIKTEPGLNQAMDGIRSRVPSISPLRGMMNHSGRTRYVVPKVAPSVTPSKRLNFANERSIVTITTTSPSSGVGFEILDMAGRSRSALSPQGRAMVNRAGGAASRYVWKGFEERREGVTRAITNIIQRYSETVNVKLKVK
jgi:hypothetical protein